LPEVKNQIKENFRSSIFRPNKSFFKPKIFIPHPDYQTAGVGRINLESSDSHIQAI
jgi:hypothetical protein